MVDFNQILLIVIIVILTGILTFVGIQIIILLKQIQKTVAKANQVLDQLQTLIQKIGNPGQSFNNIVSGIKQGANLVEIIRQLIHQKKQPTHEQQ